MCTLSESVAPVFAMLNKLHSTSYVGCGDRSGYYRGMESPETLRWDETALADAYGQRRNQADSNN
ncbi:hypothetical protein BC936DRAFT_142747 [Jimgerdemannia flammicorona]|uniref:Uncharacterized protein n=1 Tax=Jimgerdemannia flammicorona TaxID=994334 RepID=A0A432ZZW4_9FUNG|nr:hypothetical protein BC936DRAFT_142747 [Jimgerdemannia flammicorona]